MLTDYQQATVTVTHPFSPDYGRSFALVRIVGKGGKDRLKCEDDDGNIRHIKAAWTDYNDICAYAAQPKATSLAEADFSYSDLKMLAQLLDSFGKV